MIDMLALLLIAAGLPGCTAITIVGITWHLHLRRRPAHHRPVLARLFH